MEDVEVVEEKCVQAFTELVVHLSEALFRPMFLKVQYIYILIVGLL